MTKQDKKEVARKFIMDHIGIIGYGDSFEEYEKEIGDSVEAQEILRKECDRVAKLMGYQKAWFY